MNTKLLKPIENRRSTDLSESNTIKDKLQKKSKAAIFGSGNISSHLPNLYNFLACDFINCGKSYDYTPNDNNEFKYVFLAVPDQKIESTYMDLKSKFPVNVCFIHLSGSMYFENIVGSHPLMTFNQETKFEDYSKIPIFTDNKSFYSDHNENVKSLNYISPENKIIYHAMASMLGNFAQYYLFTLKKNFPNEINFEPYEQLVLASVSSMFQKDEFKKLTGPLIRGDIDVIEKHKCVLKEKNPILLELYQRFENIIFEEIKS